MFLDTSGLLCVHNSAEPQHAAAKALFKGKSRKLTSSYVLAELITLAFVRGMVRETTLRFVEKLIESRSVTIVWVDKSLHLAAMELLRERADSTRYLPPAWSRFRSGTTAWHGPQPVCMNTRKSFLPA